MKLARKHIVYAVMLALAGVTLVVDRCLGPGGGALSSAKAERTSTDQYVMPPSPPAASIEEPSPLSLADRLDALARQRGLDLAGTRDAFASGPEWPLKAPAVRADPTTPAHDAMADFRQRHQLGAIVDGGQELGAVIDGRFVHIGQTLDGFTLTEITAKAAMFQSARGRMELTLAEPSSAGLE